MADGIEVREEGREEVSGRVRLSFTVVTMKWIQMDNWVEVRG